MKYRASLVGTDGKEATMGLIEAESAQRALARVEVIFPSPPSKSYFVSLVSTTSNDDCDEDDGQDDWFDQEDELRSGSFDDRPAFEPAVRKIDPEPVRRYPIFKGGRLHDLKKWARTAQQFEWYTDIRVVGDEYVLFIGWTPIQSPEEWEFFQRMYLATDEATEWADYEPEDSPIREMNHYPWIEMLRPEDNQFEEEQQFFWDDDDDLPF